VIRGGDSEEIGHGSAKATAGLAESEGGADSGAKRPAAAESFIRARRARSTGDLERHKDAIARLAKPDLVPDGDHLGDSLVAEREGAREKTGHRHRQVEIASSDRERPDDSAGRARGHRVRRFLPFDAPRFDVGQLAHGGSARKRGERTSTFAMKSSWVEMREAPVVCRQLCQRRRVRSRDGRPSPLPAVI
jgi:hypothetical protein